MTTKKPSKHAAMAIEFHSDAGNYEWQAKNDANEKWSNTWTDGADIVPCFVAAVEYRIRPKQPKPIMGHWEYPVAFPRPITEPLAYCDPYWTIDSAGKILESGWTDGEVDEYRLTHGLCYPTKEQAEQRLKAEAAKVFVEDKG